MKTARAFLPCLLVFLALTTRSLAAPLPLPETLPADNITTNSATLHGASVWNKKQPGYVAFQIRKAGARWPVGHTPWQRVARGQTNVVFAANVTGLKQGIIYEFRAVRYVAGISRSGSLMAFEPFTQLPLVLTASPSSLDATSAILRAFINARGLETTAYIRWGRTTAYGNTTAGQTVTGSILVFVPSLVTGLLPHTIYHFQAWASNAAGIAFGSDLSFTTENPSASVLTLSPTGITTNTATLHGSANPNGLATTAWFEWGTTTNYGSKAGAVTLGAETNFVSLQTSLGGLASGVTYHFRTVATNAGGVVMGEDIAFTTVPVIVPAAPSVVTEIPSTITTNSATLHGGANPNGLATRAWFEWGTTTNYGSQTAPLALGSGTALVALEAPLDSLLTDTNYHYRLVASNSVGVTYGSNVMVTPTLLLYLYAGETWTYDFHDLPYLGSYSLPGDMPSAFAVATHPGSLSPDASVRIEFWANGSPRGFAMLSPPASGASVTWFFPAVDPAIGGQGRIQVLTGSVVIAAVALNLDIRPGGSFHYRYGGNNVIPTRLPQPALIATQFVSSVNSTVAVMQANINALNLRSGVFVQWGTTTNYGSASGSAYVDRDYVYPVSLAVSNLTPNTTYHWRTVVTNSGGVSVGEDLAFVTGALAPSVVTALPTGITGNSATLNGQVNPSGVAAAAWFEWGVTTNYENLTTSVLLPAGPGPVPVQAVINTLAADSDYHYRAVASNAAGVTYGTDVSFKTASQLPTVTSLPADSIAPNSAGIHGLATPPDSEPVLIFFEWGTSTNYGNVKVSGIIGHTGGGGIFFIHDQLTLLAPSTVYHYRLVGSNYAGLSFGANITFTTAPASAPTVTTLGPTNQPGVFWVLQGAVEPNGLESSAFFEWGLTTNYGNVSAPLTLQNSIVITEQLSSLSSNAIYHFRVVASNALGVSYGLDRYFATENSLFYGSNLRNAILAGGTITFDHDGTVSILPEIHVTNNVHLDANGHSVVLGGRLLVYPGTELRMNGVTLRDHGYQNFGTDFGAVIRLDNALLAATNCSFLNNRILGYQPPGLQQGAGLPGTDGKGGAVGAIDSQIDLVHCGFINNTAAGGAGGYGYVRPFPVYGPHGNSFGGAIYALRTRLRIVDSSFDGNTALPDNGTFGYGASFGGGAIYAESGDVAISSSFFTANLAGMQGGALFSSGLLAMTNSTFTRNWSLSSGTAVATSGSSNWIAHCTMASNSYPVTIYGASSGAALAGGGSLDLLGSILAGNAVGNASGNIIDLGHNLSSDATPAWTSGTSLNNTDPLLGPLSDNGGFTLTFPLLLGSPAIDAADPLLAPATDQRGVARPQGPAPDIGSYER